MSFWRQAGWCMAFVLCAMAFMGAAPQEKDGGKGKGDAAKGKELFEANCAICHNADSTDDKVGPGLKGISKKGPHKLSDGTQHKDHSAAVLRKQIVEGGGQMPPVGGAFSDQEVDEVVAYLMTL